MLTVAVLGPVEVRRDGTPAVVPGGKTAELLVRLALEAGTRVRTERLIDDLWADAAVGVARNTLQAKASRLRRALGQPSPLRGDSSGYVLDVDPRSVDALEVLRLSGSTATPAERERALELFRGEVLPSAGAGTWASPYRARLEETRLELLEAHAADRLARGAAAELVAELEHLVTEHPLREGLWLSLIKALYRSDRQVDALAAYRRVQAILADELGLDPGPELRRLEQRILTQDPTLAEPRPPLSVRSDPAPGNLPRSGVRLVGRDGDVAAVRELLDTEPVVTVVGPAGVGKTRLALAVAHGRRSAVGAWWVRLEHARTAASVWSAVGEAFGLSGVTEPLVLDRLRGQDTLVVLDNCEHLVDELVPVVEQMLQVAPAVRLLATSQLRLGVEGEAAYALAPLGLRDSIQLFTERAAQQRASSLTDDPAGTTVETVCRALDGLPLAIELAAARARGLSVAEIGRRLDDWFGLLGDPGSRRSPRHQTLRAALAWSYDLLFPDDQRALWAMAAFSGGAPLAAVEQVLAALGIAPAYALDVINRVIDRSLATVDVDPDGAVRYRLLDSIRAFSLEQQREAGVRDQVQAAHAAWFVAAADRVAAGVRGPDQAERLRFVRTERANLDAALAWTAAHDPVLGLRIATGCGWAWVVLGAGAEGADRMRAALDAAADLAPAHDRAIGLLLAGWLEASGGDLDRATRHIEDGMAIADDELRAGGRLHLAFVRSQQGRAEEALVLLRDSRAVFKPGDHSWELAAGWVLTAWAETARGHTDQGREACHRALELIDIVGDDWGRIHAEAILGALAQAEHRFDEATGHLARAAAAAHGLGFAAAEAHHLTNLGRARQQAGDLVAAAQTLENAITVAVSTGDQRTASLARVRLARVLRALGRPGAAREAAAAARRWYAAAGGGDGAALADCLLACLDVEVGAADAEPRIASVATAAHAAGDLEVEVLALDGLALAYTRGGRREEARNARDRADAVMATAQHLIDEADRIDRKAVEQRLTERPVSV